MSSSNGHASPWIALAIIAAGAVALIVHARSYPFVTYDDAFISLRYSQRLVEGHGLTWTEGAPVEGYSNLLWILGCAALGALGVPWVDTPVVLGIASGIALIAALVYGFAPRRWNESLPALAAAMFVALAGPIGIWAVGGLEGCLVGALLAWALVLLRPLLDEETTDWKRGLVPGIPLALLCLTRPDGPLITIVICGFLLLRGRSTRALGAAIGVGLLPALATLGQLGFRLAYYGDWLPNTARAKVAFTAARLQSGGECVAEAGASSYALWIPAAFAIYVAWRDQSRRPRIALWATLLVVWLAYTTTITCQEFGYRMLIPCYVLLAFLVGETLAWVQERGKAATALAWVGVLALIPAFAYAQQRDQNIAIARWNNPPVSVQAESIGKVLGAAFSDRDPLLAVDAAGAIPYFSGLRSLDMLGLNDAHIARHHGDSFGQGVQGHELGDGAYVLSREPDIILAGVTGTSRLAFRGGKEMDADPRFHERYRRVRMFGDDPVPVRFNAFYAVDGRVGVDRAEGRATIPGYFFASAKGTQARLDEEGRLVARFLTTARSELRGIALEEGTWRLTANGNGSLELSGRRQSDRAPATRIGHALEIVLEERGLVDLALTGRESAVAIEVIAQRVASAP